ncbi:helicase DnaB, partial [Lactobacillus sp. UMNPBX19]
YGIKLRTLQTNEADLMIQKALYGLSDIELVRVIQATTSPNKQIDLPAIKKSLEGNFRKIQVRTKGIETKVQTNEPKQSSNDESNPAIRLVQTVKSVAPLQFLKNLRQKNNGFVADNEVKAISDIAEMNIIEPEVL